MNKLHFINTLKDFTNLIESNETQENYAKLEYHLDKIAILYHQINFKFDEIEYPDSPDLNYQEVRKLSEKIFPEFGPYNIVLNTTTKLCKTKLALADSVDDLTDIYIDIKNVIWKWENTSEDDAIWFFEWSFQNHFGEHLRHLQMYLHALKSDL